MTNKNLSAAKKAKNDEFYTMYEDVEKELKHYTQHLKDKVVYCNCDTEKSNFYKYFKNNFETLGLKGLLRSSLADGIPFQSEAGIDMLKQADIVVTNPPFSLFRDFIKLIFEYNKQFLVIGNQNAITYKEVFKLIKENKLWLGINSVKEFLKPDKTTQKFGNICWFTNLTHNKRNEKLFLYKTYTPEEYQKYDNYDAINVNKVKDIPVDYFKVVGVPITFLDKFNPNQFEIVGATISGDLTQETENLRTCLKHRHSPFINGVEIYKRILIKRKDTNESFM